LKGNLIMDWKGIVDKIVIGVVSAAVLGGLALLWNFGSSGGLIRALGGSTVGVPSGAVLAFDLTDLDEDHCPEGWSPFLYARGRTLVGAGDPQKAPEKMALDERSRKLEGYVLRQHGGEQVHHLDLDELPLYTPSIAKQNGYAFVAREGTAVPCLDGDQGCSHLNVITEGRPGLSTTPLAIVGFGKADSTFNLRPPFVAVYYCRKI
jgi:hypothetical protein